MRGSRPPPPTGRRPHWHWPRRPNYLALRTNFTMFRKVRDYRRACAYDIASDGSDAQKKRLIADFRRFRRVTQIASRCHQPDATGTATAAEGEASDVTSAEGPAGTHPRGLATHAYRRSVDPAVGSHRICGHRCNRRESAVVFRVSKEASNPFHFPGQRREKP